MQYYYDQRSGQWRKMEESTCPMDECTEQLDQDLGSPSIVACPTCQETMDYYTRLLATCLHTQVGTPLTLTNPHRSTLVGTHGLTSNHTTASGSRPPGKKKKKKKHP
jgi:hypothetical protein